jgi:hypothetical protein
MGLISHLLFFLHLSFSSSPSSLFLPKNGEMGGGGLYGVFIDLGEVGGLDPPSPLVDPPLVVTIVLN